MPAATAKKAKQSVAEAIKAAPKTIPAAKRKAEAASKKETVAPISSGEISDQIEAFLKKGGKIQKIPNGVSGQQNGQLPTRKHIVISKKK